MAGPVRFDRARRLEYLASDLHSLAFDVAEPSRYIVRSDRITAEGERIAAAVRAAFRGGLLGRSVPAVESRG
jgi:hypothetical protein